MYGALTKFVSSAKKHPENYFYKPISKDTKGIIGVDFLWDLSYLQDLLSVQ